MVTMASLDSLRTKTSEAPSINVETFITSADSSTPPMASAASASVNKLEDQSRCESPCQSPLSPQIPAFFSGSQPVLQMLRKSITPTRYQRTQAGKGAEKMGKAGSVGATGQKLWGRLCDTLQQRLGCFAADPHTLDRV